MADQDEWHRHWMSLALTTAKLSKDPSTKCGAVIVTLNNKQCSVGYNGPPSGFDDSESDWNSREVKYEMVIHAEENAILNCPFPKDECKIYVSHRPCHKCMIRIMQVGIKEIYWNQEYMRLTSTHISKDIWERVAANMKVVKQI